MNRRFFYSSQTAPSARRSAALLIVPCLIAWLFLAGTVTPAAARSGTGIELLSGVGYKNASEGPSFLLGAELSAYVNQGSFFSELQETRVGMHISDVFTVEANENTFTLGVDSEWTRTQGPISFSLGGHVFYRSRGTTTARTAGLFGTGATGRIHGRFRTDYVENALGAFPWFQKDLEGLSEMVGDTPFYRGQVSVSASIIPAYRLNWSQEIKWRRPVSGTRGVMSVTTGPQFNVGPGTIGVQGGIIFDNSGVEPVWQIRYELRPFQSNIDLQLTAATRSLDGENQVLYGWLGIDGERMDVGAAIRFEETDVGRLSPTLYFSLHPKF